MQVRGQKFNQFHSWKTLNLETHFPLPQVNSSSEQGVGVVGVNCNDGGNDLDDDDDDGVDDDDDGDRTKGETASGSCTT